MFMVQASSLATCSKVKKLALIKRHTDQATEHPMHLSVDNGRHDKSYHFRRALEADSLFGYVRGGARASDFIRSKFYHF